MQFRILGIVPVHNRKDTTLKFLKTVQDLLIDEDASLDLLIIDDDSTDGTSDAIAEQFPNVEVYKSTGDLFWSGAVRRGLMHFLNGSHTHALLLNDDIELCRNAIHELLTVARKNPHRICSGTIVSDDGRIIYGGIFKNKFFRFRKAGIEDFNGRDYIEVDTVNGNLLLIPRSGLADFKWPPIGTYVQEGFDLFLGLEASRLGKSPLAVRKAKAIGAENGGKFWFYSEAYPLDKRIKGILGPKGMRPQMYWHLTRRYSGSLAPIYFLLPYIRATFPRSVRKAQSLLPRFKRVTHGN